MYSAIQTGQNHGMQTLDQALETLVARGIISRLEAARRAVDKRMFV
jgi:twitching motility protein PilT